jgi:ABC-2 type transport system permease protein
MKNIINLKRTASIARKEVRHILRDPFTLGLGIGLPMLVVLFFGLAIDFNVHDICLTAYDSDHSRASRQLMEVFKSSGYFLVRDEAPALDDTKVLNAGTAKAVLIIPPRFGQSLETGKKTTAQVLIDGTDNSTAGVIGGYMTGIQKAASERLLNVSATPPVSLKTRFLFNPELNSRWFTVPGLSAVVLAIISIILTALTVAREWENGSMELLLSTPVHPLEIIMGKLAPYVALGVAAQALIYCLARFYFGIPFEGSHVLFLAGTFLFVSANMALGLLFSVATRQQMLAMQLSIIIGMLPNLLLSGFIFPIESMPAFFRYFTMIFPARWFMVVIRGVFLRGADLSQLAGPIFILTVMAAFFVLMAVKRFKKDLEP